MKRPLFVIGLVYAAAAWIAFLLAPTEALQISAAAAVTALAVWLFRGRFRRALEVSASLLAVAAALGAYSLYMWRSVLPLQAFAGREAVVEGLVTEAETFARSVNYTVRASLPEYPGAPKNFMIVLRCYGEQEYNAGDTVRCRTTLEIPTQRVSYYNSRGVFVTGKNASFEGPADGGFAWTARLIKLREQLRANLYSVLSPSVADIVSAMVLGFGDNIPSDIYSALNRAGTSHLLTVSGLHLSVLTAFALALLKKLRCPDRAAGLFAIAAAFLFAALVGFGASVLRAFVMTAMMLLARTVSSRADSRNSLGLALLLACAARPFWILSPGLWLSASSTLGIITLSGRWQSWIYDRYLTGSPARDRFVRLFGGALAVSAAAYAFSLPVLLIVSGYVSLLAPLANVFIAPFAPIALIGGIFCALAGDAGAASGIAAFLTEISTAAIVRISELFASLRFASVSLGESYLLIWLGLAAVAVAISARQKDRTFRLAAALLCLFSFSVGNISLNITRQSTAELVTIDFSDCAAVIRGDEAVMLGTPTRAEAERWARYFAFRGVRRMPAAAAMDCPDNPGTGLARLDEEFGIGCVVGPNDAYILEQLAASLPGTPVYSGGYAALTALGGLEATMRLPKKEIYISAGGWNIVKTRRNYDTTEPYAGGDILVFGGGAIAAPKSAAVAFEPVAARIFGEKRVYLPL